MKKRLLPFLLIGMIASFYGCTEESNTTSEASISAGTDGKAPGFSLVGSDGKTHSLSDHKGKFVVLEWSNFGCPFVKKHYDGGDMQKLQAEFAAQGVVWYLINSSAEGKQGHVNASTAPATHAKMAPASKAILLDLDGKVGRLYNAKVTPHMYIINPEGDLIYQGAIDSIRSTDSSDVAKATNYVKEALNAAMAGKPIAETNTKAYGCSVKYAK